MAAVSDALGWQEPVEAYRRLRDAGWRPVLLGGGPQHPEGRFSYIACNPVQEYRVVEGVAHVRAIPPGTGVPTRAPIMQGEPVASLRRWIDTHLRPAATSAPFTGGFVGYFGYGFCQHLDPHAGRQAPHWMPDALLWLCPDALVFDHDHDRVILHSQDLQGCGDPEKRHRAIREALHRLAKEPTPAAGVTAWHPSMDQQQYEAGVESVRKRVSEGDLFQANIATRFTGAWRGDPADLFARLARDNPSPFMTLLETEEGAIVSGSPEQLFGIRNQILRSRPIAGTRPRHADPARDAGLAKELLLDEKEQAEHTMLVDLVRNDVARVSCPGSVRVSEVMSVERYRHVMHLVSQVEGDLRPDAHFVDVLSALFPGGTITGAPKMRAIQRILEVEPVARGPYTGSAGFLSLDGNAQWNILIRTLVATPGRLELCAGSGIVADSHPTREWEEACSKARAFQEAASGGHRSGVAAGLGSVQITRSWEPPDPPGKVDARVLLIDNVDSFVYNLADYFASLGAPVQVIRNDQDWRAAVRSFEPTHIVLSPGPGRPEEAGCCIGLVRELAGRLPILGVCLGHQAIAAAHGARVVVGQPVHGKRDLVYHDEALPLPSPFAAARYHSLVVDEATLPDQFTVDARLADGTVMAISDQDAGLFGVQFHPESFATEGGMKILLGFLRTPVPSRRQGSIRATVA